MNIRQLLTAAWILLSVVWVFPQGERLDKSPPWTSLFDGKVMGGWNSTKFGGEGEVRIKDGQLLLDTGDDMTGVTWTLDFPKQNYEIQLEAMRLSGGDFFCGLTFPVKESHCSLIVGGWGGTMVGLSNINGRDASDNETSQMMVFKDQTWYKIRIRVEQEKIQAWINEKSVFDLEMGTRRFSVRSEVEWSKPVGISTWRTAAALRDIRMRRLP